MVGRKAAKATGRRRVVSLAASRKSLKKRSPENALDLQKLAKVKQLSVDLHTKQPIVGDALLSLLLQSRDGLACRRMDALSGLAAVLLNSSAAALRSLGPKVLAHLTPRILDDDLSVRRHCLKLVRETLLVPAATDLHLQRLLQPSLTMSQRLALCALQKPKQLDGLYLSFLCLKNCSPQVFQDKTSYIHQVVPLFLRLFPIALTPGSSSVAEALPEDCLQPLCGRNGTTAIIVMLLTFVQVTAAPASEETKQLPFALFKESCPKLVEGSIGDNKSLGGNKTGGQSSSFLTDTLSLVRVVTSQRAETLRGRKAQEAASLLLGLAIALLRWLIALVHLRNNSASQRADSICSGIVPSPAASSLAETVLLGQAAGDNSYINLETLLDAGVLKAVREILSLLQKAKLPNIDSIRLEIRMLLVSLSLCESWAEVPAKTVQEFETLVNSLLPEQPDVKEGPMQVATPLNCTLRWLPPAFVPQSLKKAVAQASEALTRESRYCAYILSRCPRLKESRATAAAQNSEGGCATAAAQNSEGGCATAVEKLKDSGAEITAELHDVFSANPFSALLD